MDYLEQLRGLDLQTLTELVRKDQNDAFLEIDEWQAEPLDYSSGMPTTGGLFRVSGLASNVARKLKWSIICKVIVPNDEGVQAPYYWKREALVYMSGIFADLPGGLSMPRCIDVFEYPEADWIWLEEIIEDGKEWDADRFALTALHLGRFNGGYVNSKILSSCDWLSQDWLQARLRDPETVTETLCELEGGDHPLVRQAFAVLPVARLKQLYEKRDNLLSVVSTFPQTICHRDFTCGNVMFSKDADEQERIVVIDWGFAGSGVFGEDLGHFLAATLFGLQNRCRKASELDRILWDSYLSGLLQAGWQGHTKIVRYGSIVSATLRWSGLWLDWFPYILQDDLRVWFEDKFHHSADNIVSEWSKTLVFLLDLVDDLDPVFSN